MKLTEGGVIEETLLDIYVNGQELATVMCSPLDQEALALGFLYTEGVIDALGRGGAGAGQFSAHGGRRIADASRLRAAAAYGPDQRLRRRRDHAAHHGVVSAACNSDFRTQPLVILQRMRDLQGAARLYNAVRGVHTAVLADEERLLLGAEDVGRHNAVDKIAGLALQGGIATRDRLLLSSGRISSEMLSKARRLDIPLVASRTAPTSTAIRLAEAWQMCVIGYVRRGGLRAYTHAWRLGLGEERAT